MSAEARAALTERLVYRNESDKLDLLDENLTQTFLIAFLIDIADAADAVGCKVLLTAVRSDHPTVDGPHGHNGGFAADGWLLNSAKDGDYVSGDGSDERFAKWLAGMDASPYRRQIGLGGEAHNDKNLAAITVQLDRDPITGFLDSSVDHVHMGSTIA